MSLGLTGSPTVNTDTEAINPYYTEFNENTRVLQWKHYFEVINKPSTENLRGREFYMESILKRFDKYKIPKERAEIYAEIPGIESAWRSDANSPAGAKGLWQTMPATAQRYGYKLQDMSNPVSNTDCAIRYLAFLDSLYNGNVAAAIFAYNGGEGTVNSAMKQYKTDDVWLIEFKSRETYNFAPKVLGAWLYNKEQEAI